MEDNIKEELRNNLNDLLKDDSNIPDEVPELSNKNSLDKLDKKVSSLTLPQKTIIAKNKAKRVMSSLLKFYLSEDIIKEHEYIKAKARLDTFALSMLIQQMYNSEIAINAIMDDISGGFAKPQMFEVLGELQRTLLDIIKNQTMYLISVEENMKKISYSLDVYKTKRGNKLSKGGNIKQRGTKDLMKAINNVINDDTIQDVDSIEEDDSESIE